jgi:hypothetical protein
MVELSMAELLWRDSVRYKQTSFLTIRSLLAIIAL